MKPKSICMLSCMLILSLLITSEVRAQQTQFSQPGKPVTLQTVSSRGNGAYTYRLFIAPNKVFGYDIFQNGRIIFHQPALAQPAGNKQVSIIKKEQAEKAAALAIEKIKKGISPELTREEVMQITARKL